MKAKFNKDDLTLKFDGEKVKEIITDVNVIGERSNEIDPRKQGTLVQEITLALKNTIKANQLTSLSAPAIGYPYRVFCIAFNNGQDIRTFVNPIIGNAEGFDLSRETCSSIPGKTFIRPRNNKILLMYMSPMGKIESRSIAGYTARVVQHEIDHLDGLLLSDIGLEIDEQFDNAPEEERLEVINAYLDSLDIKQKQLKSEIREDEELKRIDDTIEYMTAAQKGEIEVETVPIDKEIIEEKIAQAKAAGQSAESNTGGEVTPPKKRGRKPKVKADGNQENTNIG